MIDSLADLESLGRIVFLGVFLAGVIMLAAFSVWRFLDSKFQSIFDMIERKFEAVYACLDSHVGTATCQERRDNCPCVGDVRRLTDRVTELEGYHRGKTT